MIKNLNRRFCKAKTPVYSTEKVGLHFIKGMLYCIKMKEEVKEMSEKNNSTSFGLGLLAGVIGGIVTGILYAPESGEKARTELKGVIEDFSEKHSPEIKEAKKQALESIDLVKYKLERQYRKINHILKSRKLQKAKELEDTKYDFN